MSFTPEQERALEELVDARVQRVRDEQRERLKHMQQGLDTLYSEMKRFKETSLSMLEDVKRLTEEMEQTYKDSMDNIDTGNFLIFANFGLEYEMYKLMMTCGRHHLK